MTAHRCAGGLKKKLRSWTFCTLFFNVPIPSKHRHGPPFLRFFWETAPFQSTYTTRMGIRRTYSPRVPTGGGGGGGEGGVLKAALCGWAVPSLFPRYVHTRFIAVHYSTLRRIWWIIVTILVCASILMFPYCKIINFLFKIAKQQAKAIC